MKRSNEEKRVIIYCRESRDDYGENYERIETQRDLLIKYCKSNGYTNIVDIIMDDDKSGTDFGRFDDIKEKAKKKMIDVIVFKNSARLGRNQKEAISFVEYLEEHGVEIIFEDEQYNEEMFGLYAWFNERRARDDSKNIRRNLRHKIEEGELLVKAIYGYDKVGKKLVINNETSIIVKEIFNLYNKGWGYNKIATYLNEKNIPTPSQSRNFTNTKKALKWKAQHISRILDDRRYIGDYVGGRTEKVSFKSKKIRLRLVDEWTIIPNHHEPIIERELYEKIQQQKKERKIINRNNVEKEQNLYSGIIFCGKCGSQMYMRKGTTGNKKRPDCYLCKKYCNEGKLKDDNGCYSHRIRKIYLDNILNNYIEKMLNNQEIKEFAVNNIKEMNEDKIVLEGKIEKEQQLIEKLQKQYKQLYEDKLNEVIPEFLYKEKQNEIETKLKIETEEQEKLEKTLEELNKLKNREEIIKKNIEIIKKDGLTREEILKLFENIIVFRPKEIVKEKYCLDEEEYKKIYKYGGIIFNLKYTY